MAVSKRRRRTTITKSVARPNIQPAATFTADQVQALMQAGTSTAGLAVPLPREPNVPFGPGVPILPALIDPVRPDGSGRPEPRIYEYPVSINLPGMTDRLVPWKVLRDAAEVPVVRDCIRIRKNEITTLDWDIVVSKRALQTYKKLDPDTSSVKIKKDLREKLDPDVARLIEFWQQPDFEQGENFVEWCTKALEEHLVLDALCIWPYSDRGGNRAGLRLIDGSTIKVLRNGLGGRPMPPHPAYQQVLWGFPRGEFEADTDSEGNVPGGFPADRLIYRRREVRTTSPYGFSAVEQALQDVDLYLRRFEWDKAQYTDGVQPAGWIKNTGVESWTPQQIVDYNHAFNDLYAGQTLNRMRYHLLPPGMEPMESADIPEKFKPDYHLHLVKLVAMHFDVTLAELGFTEAKGLGSAGFHEGQENVQQRKATNPTLKWLQSVLTQISRTHLGMPGELEFRFLGLDSEEEAAADSVIDEQLKSGRITFNEAREEMGRAPYAFDEADMPIVETARGIIFLENSSQLVAPGELVTPAQAPPITGPPEGTDAAQDDPNETDPAPTPAQPPTGKPADAAGATKMELAAYHKWVSNGRAKRRPFEFEHLTAREGMRHGIDPDRVLFKTTGVDDHPKVGHAWPAWEQDIRIANHWATQLRAALTGAPTRALANRWLDVRKAADTDQDRRRDALQWLTTMGFTLAPQIRGILAGLYVDAYMVGDHSARDLLDRAEHVGWGGWTAGDTATARDIIERDGMTPGLARMVGQVDRIAGGINTTRLRSVAGVLGDAVDSQPTVDDLDAELQALLDDETSAGLVTLTETTRAVTQAALDRYTIAPGITNYMWVTEGDGKVCPLCQANAAVGSIPIGESFPYGGVPPAHARCRCALLPELSSPSLPFGL